MRAINPHASGYSLITRWTQKKISPHSAVKHDYVHDEYFTPSCKSSILARNHWYCLRKGIASSMAGCCVLVRKKSRFYLLQRQNWIKPPNWHHSAFKSSLNLLWAWSETSDHGIHCCLTNWASASIWLLLGKHNPVSGRCLQKAAVLQQVLGYCWFQTDGEMDLCESDLANPCFELLLWLSSSSSSAASGSLLHHWENGLVKNLRAVSSRLLNHFKSSLVQASRQGKQQRVAPLNAWASLPAAWWAMSESKLSTDLRSCSLSKTVNRGDLYWWSDICGLHIK